MSSENILKNLKSLHPKVIDLSLARVDALLAKLDHPERKIPPVIHITGTNGKGSLVASLRAIFAAAGYRAHSYISPHLVDFAERITIAGRQISEEELAHYLAVAESANAGQPITFFEITTVAAFLAFAEHKADILLLEVGLGGRLDATNVIERPILTAITPISLDHQHYLGGTIAEIAAEKSGILKPGVTAIIGPQPPDAIAAITERATKIGANLLIHGRDWQVSTKSVDKTAKSFGKNSDNLSLSDPFGHNIYPPPSLYGAHQYINVGTALVAARALRPIYPALNDDILSGAVQNISWPARMHPLHGSNIATILAPDLGTEDELWLDGGHNAGAGEALVETIRNFLDKELILIFGMLETKDPAGFLRPLVPYISCLYTIAIPNEPLSLPADHMAALARKLGINATPSQSVTEALRNILAANGTATRNRRPRRILICGSLYLAGSVLAMGR